jgi:orotate phosphoribosyltransferase
MNESEVDAREQAQEILEKRGAFVREHIVLASGRHAIAKVECEHLTLGDAEWFAGVIATHFAGLEFGLVAGVPTGGMHIAAAVAMACRAQRGRATHVEFLETWRTDSGFAVGLRQRIAPVLVVEDVTTTGGSVRWLIKALEEKGLQAAGVAVLWDRGELGEDAFGGVPFYPVVRKHIPSWDASECLVCRSEKPGREEG